MQLDALGKNGLSYPEFFFFVKNKSLRCLRIVETKDSGMIPT